ncbi:Hypothetical protein CINCED_3A022308 [Cinara cedri]|nr:Hypothetical protein CINCED_3A022308 [Cinara cedri]
MKTGVDIMTPTVIIGAVTDNRNTGYNPLSDISEEQTAWIGSMVYLFPPVGSVVASMVQDHFGSRQCMMLSNVTNLATIVILMFADTPEFLYNISALIGFNVGFVTSITISYSSEVCEPKLRGVLTSVINLSYFAGYLCVTMLYAITANWKLSVLITVAIPVANAVLLFKTPDSPMWLLSKGRIEEAKQTLRKLRGGASEENCIKEFQDMVHYTSKMDLNDLETGDTKTEKSTMKNSFYYLIEPETLKPLQMLVIIIFFTTLLSGIPFIPYLMSVFDTFGTPIHPAWAMTMHMAFGVSGNVLTIFLINRLGKRVLSLATMATCSVCFLCIGTIGNFCLPSPMYSWIQVILFFMSTFSSSMGIMPIMWVLMGEVYPMKTKNIGAGVSTAVYFIVCFVMTKLYRNLEVSAGFYNTFVLFGVSGLVGLTYLYYQLPETENRTLEEISEHFKRKSTKIDIQTG